VQCCKPPEPQGGTRGILSYSACRYSCSCQAKPSQAKPSQARPGQAVARLCTVGPQCQHTAGLPTYLPGWLSSTETTCGRNQKTVHRVSLTAKRTARQDRTVGPQGRSQSAIAAACVSTGTHSRTPLPSRRRRRGAEPTCRRPEQPPNGTDPPRWLYCSVTVGYAELRYSMRFDL
jgi:hypothetical protein